MGTTNGYRNGRDSESIPLALFVRSKKNILSQQQLLALIERLKVPFDPASIQWKVVETKKAFGRLRGRVIPYADLREYYKRLNELVSPIGWSQSFTVATAHVGSRDRGPASAKIIAICQLTIHALGIHSSTGEGWASDENGSTTAEAQALKRAAACFGLGEYLYYIPGFWVDVDKDEVPLTVPTLPEWATPEGWLRGARPGPERVRDASGGVPDGFDLNIICQIEKMHANLGTQVYRRILKGYRVWEPTQIPDPETAAKVLSEMEAVEKQLNRAAHAFDRVGRTAGEEILRSFALKSISDFGDLPTLEKVVSALEERVTTSASTS